MPVSQDEKNQIMKSNVWLRMVGTIQKFVLFNFIITSIQNLKLTLRPLYGKQASCCQSLNRAGTVHVPRTLRTCNRSRMLEPSLEATNCFVDTATIGSV